MAGTETALHAFGNEQGYANPDSGLINAGGALYRTTQSGGTDCDCGTVFSIIP
jgi:uncharacterized repeat protein (TIGR03803 family)